MCRDGFVEKGQKIFCKIGGKTLSPQALDRYGQPKTHTASVRRKIKLLKITSNKLINCQINFIYTALNRNTSLTWLPLVIIKARDLEMRDIRLKHINENEN